MLALGAVVLLPAPALALRFHPSRAPGPGLPWLSVDAGRIVNSAGHSVLLRGFNDDALLQTGRAPLPPALTADDAALMEEQGFDVVRIPVSWSRLEPAPGRFSASYLRRVAAMVRVCAQHGLYSVLDLHTQDFGVAFGGSGAPSWLYLPAVPDWHIPGIPEAWQRHASPAVNAALAFFWLYPNWQRLYWRAWQVLARHFAADPAVAGYDLYNEPHPLPIPPGLFSSRILFPFYAQGVRRIAEVDPNHLFFLEGNLFGDLPTPVVPVRAPDLVYSTHLYQGSLIGPAFHGSLAPLRAELEQGIAAARELPGAYWTGELGIDHHRPDAVAWARAEIRLSDRYLTGWAWWQWDDPSGWGVRDGSGALDRPWLSVLSQPYLQAVPGRLTSMRFDLARSALTVKVADAPVGARALLAWPGSDGTPEIQGGCARLDGSPGPGRRTVRLLAPSCTFTVARARQ